MKTLIHLILALSFISCDKKPRNTRIKNLYMKDFANHRFLSNVILGYGNEISEIKLWRDNRKDYVKSVGVSTNFMNDTFSSGNFAPCGNDYFTHVNGKFLLYDRHKIVISVDSITYSGEDKRPTEFKNGIETDYIISQKKDTIILTKID